MVKSAGLVLGPFTVAELADAIQTRQVLLLDEVKGPNLRWKFLREQSELAEVVAAALDKETTREKTSTLVTKSDITTKSEEPADADIESKRFKPKLEEELTPIPVKPKMTPTMPDVRVNHNNNVRVPTPIFSQEISKFERSKQQRGEAHAVHQPGVVRDRQGRNHRGQRTD